MTTVLATGTFDLLHPGHLHYLGESAALGDELHVILSRESVVEHKDPMIPVEQRCAMVGALAAVDEAHVGSEESIFEPLHAIEPDVVTLGYDQGFDEDELSAALEERGFDADVVRIGPRDEDDGMLTSTSAIVELILERRTD